MKKLTVFSSILAGLLLVSGCASVNFYSDPELKNETGLRYYTLKPYLLVEFMAEKDNTVKTTVIYLPDIENPQYMVLRPGIGSNNLKMDFANSALQSYGIVSESQFPATVEALAAMLSKSAYAAQTFTRPEATDKEGGTAFRLYEIITAGGGTALKEIIPVVQKSQTPLP